MLRQTGMVFSSSACSLQQILRSCVSNHCEHRTLFSALVLGSSNSPPRYCAEQYSAAPWLYVLTPWKYHLTHVKPPTFCPLSIMWICIGIILNRYRENILALILPMNSLIEWGILSADLSRRQFLPFGGHGFTFFSVGILSDLPTPLRPFGRIAIPKTWFNGSRNEN